MELMELLKPEVIMTDLAPRKDKKEILGAMVNYIAQDYTASQKHRIKKALLEREALGSTAIGGGVALPHIRLRLIKKMTLVVAFSKQGYLFDAIDNKKTHIVFMLLQPLEDTLTHLKVLSQISTIFHNPANLDKLFDVNTTKELVDRIGQCLHQRKKLVTIQ